MPTVTITKENLPKGVLQRISIRYGTTKELEPANPARIGHCSRHFIDALLASDGSVKKLYKTISGADAFCSRRVLLSAAVHFYKFGWYTTDDKGFARMEPQPVLTIVNMA